MGTPEPPPPYKVEDAFPKIKFQRPTEIAAMPGSDRLFVVELQGKIYSFPDRRDAERADLAVDLAALPGFHQIYGIAFHPQFERNRYVYLMYAQKAGRADGSHLSRFVVKPTEPPTIDLASETLLLTWYSGGHNAGCLRFAPDGTLYLATGDGAEPFPPDRLNVGQTVNDLMSAILRIDVDHPDKGKAYGIPRDNPFVAMAGARPEIWAYGLRNPWRFTIDPVTSELWAADVGWETWEMVHRIERGGNYGWPVMEGPLKVRADAKPGPTPILPAVAVHPHTEARSITGGHVYRGKALPELEGAYVYGDFETGKLWGIRYDGKEKRVTWNKELADTRRNPVSFGVDRHGEPLLLDYGGAIFTRQFAAAGLYRLVRNPAAGANQRFPRRLSDTGLFGDVRKHALAAGVVPYAVNAEPWADGAAAERFVGLPGKTQVDVEKLNRNKWLFPVGTVFGKTMSLAKKRLETQLLHFDGEIWRPYSYRWDDQGRDATLVDARGEQTKSWRFAARGECATCHNVWSGPVLGFRPPQLARGQQLANLTELGVLSVPPRDPFPRLVGPYDAEAPLDARARSWLDVNCAHCHRVGAGGMAALQLLFETEIGRSETVGARPTQGTFGLSGGAVIVAGDPFRSVLFYRLTTLGSGHMPRLGARELDSAGLDLIERWIGRIPAASFPAPPPPEPAYAATLAAAQTLRGSSVRKDEAVAPLVDRLLGSTSGALMLVRALDRGMVAPSARQETITRGSTHERPEIRGLFERFIPEEQRAARLGETIDPQQILTLAGQAERGKRLFLQGGAGCFVCHKVGDQGGTFGPTLDRLGTKYSPFQLLEQILSPSRKVEPQYMMYVAELTDGQTQAGLLVEKKADHVALKDAAGTITRIPSAQLKALVVQDKSPMPDQLLSALTAQEAADLVAFLASLK